VVALASVAAGCLIVALGAAWFLSSWAEGLCADSAAETITSPDGRLKAVAFDRSCGAMTSNSEQLSILPISGKLENTAGNAFVAGRREAFSFRWTGARSIEITGSRATAFRAPNEVRVPLGFLRSETVRITYRP
jgi:hypothetical protein